MGKYEYTESEVQEIYDLLETIDKQCSQKAQRSECRIHTLAERIREILDR